MKLTLTLVALLAVSASAVSAYSTSGTLYTYVSSIPHPRTTFLKKGSGHDIVTDGVACNGPKTLPGKGHPGALYGEFTTVNNQWDFNGQHDNEIMMGKDQKEEKKSKLRAEGGGGGDDQLTHALFPLPQATSRSLVPRTASA